MSICLENSGSFGLLFVSFVNLSVCVCASFPFVFEGAM